MPAIVFLCGRENPLLSPLQGHVVNRRRSLYGSFMAPTPDQRDQIEDLFVYRSSFTRRSLLDYVVENVRELRPAKITEKRKFGKGLKVLEGLLFLPQPFPRGIRYVAAASRT